MTGATSQSSPGITTKVLVTDRLASGNEPWTIEDWQAQCTAYRHAIKDVVREPDPIRMKEALAKLLSDDAVGTLGRDFHFIIKHAVQMVAAAEAGEEDPCREATAEIFKKVKELPQGATVKGWLSR